MLMGSAHGVTRSGSLAAPAGSSATRVTAGGRRHELDWLRVVVVLGLIPYHAAVVFTVGPGDYIQNGQRSLAFDAAATLVAFAGMPLLFFVAGAATWYALGHRGPLAYLAERPRRLAVPLLFGILALVPIQLYVDRVNAGGSTLSYPQFYRQFLIDWLRIGQLGLVGHGFQFWGHLWFLLYLLAVCVFLLPLLSWLRHGPGEQYAARLAHMSGRPLGLLLFGLPLSLVEVILQGPIGPRPALDYNNLYSGAAGLVLYAVAFVLGYLLVPDAVLGWAVVRYRTQLLALGLSLLAAHELAIGVFSITSVSGPLATVTIALPTPSSHPPSFLRRSADHTAGVWCRDMVNTSCAADWRTDAIYP